MVFGQKPSNRHTNVTQPTLDNYSHQIHYQTLGSWKNPNLQMHDNVTMNAVNEIAHWTSDIRHKPGKEFLMQHLLSQPFNSSGYAYHVLLTICQEKCGSFCSYMPPMSSGQTEPNGQGWSWTIDTQCMIKCSQLFPWMLLDLFYHLKVIVPSYSLL